MNRRRFLVSTAGSTTILAGCISSDDGTTEGNGTPSNNSTEPSNSENNISQGENSTEPDYDTVIDYSTHVQSSASGKYDLPDPRYDWSWLVVDFEVVEGQLDMEDVWFRGLTETDERYYTVSPLTDQVEDGIESRGAIREGTRGVMLHAYPPSPAADVIGPMFSATRTAIGGEGVGTDGPTDLYPSVSVEYSVETAQDPDVLPSEYAAPNGEMWAVVTLNVTEGVLNLEDVWFRSQLITESRLHDCDPYSRFADRGVRSRGLVKTGYSATALYQIAEDESVERWGYTEDGRQNVSITRI